MSNGQKMTANPKIKKIKHKQKGLFLCFLAPQVARGNIYLPSFTLCTLPMPEVCVSVFIYSSDHCLRHNTKQRLNIEGVQWHPNLSSSTRTVARVVLPQRVTEQLRFPGKPLFVCIIHPREIQAVINSFSSRVRKSDSH